MATGGDDQPPSGYEGRDWSTEHEPDLTQRECQRQTEWIAVGDGVYYQMQHRQGDSDLEDAASVEDHAESLPPEAESVVDNVRREKLVTQLAVHSASDDLPIGAWQAGDATQPSVCTPYDPKVAQQPTTLGRHVTNGAQRGAKAAVQYPSGHLINDFDYAKDALCQRSGFFLSSYNCNENTMQPGQQCTVYSSDAYRVNPGITNNPAAASSLGGHRVGGLQSEYQQAQHVTADSREDASAMHLYQRQKMIKLEQEISRLYEELKRMQAGNAQSAGHPQTAIESSLSVAYAASISNHGTDFPHSGPINDRGQTFQANRDDERPRMHWDKNLAMPRDELTRHRSVNSRRPEHDDRVERRSAVSSRPLDEGSKKQKCHSSLQRHNDGKAGNVSSDQSGRCDSSSSSSSDGSDSNRDDSEDNRGRTRRRNGGRRRRGRRNGTHGHRNQSNKVPWLKPEKFTGHGSFETFLVQFENCAKYSGWSAEDKAAHLRWALTGTAAQLLWDAEDLSYAELLEKLKRRFSGKGMEEKYQTELRCRRRGRGESLRELAQDIRRLMALAYPGEKSRMSENIARDSFLTALNDPELELKIREREVVGLDEALKVAQRLEVFKSAVGMSVTGRQRVNRQVVDDVSDEVSCVDLETRVKKLEKEKAGVNKQVAASPVAIDSQQPNEIFASGVQSKDATNKRQRNLRSNGGNDDQLHLEMSKIIDKLQMNCQAADEEKMRLNAENAALNKSCPSFVI